MKFKEELENWKYLKAEKLFTGFHRIKSNELVEETTKEIYLHFFSCVAFYVFDNHPLICFLYKNN